MKNKTTKQGCAGNCAGKSSNNGFKTPKFQRVKDSKGKPIRGVWIRGKQDCRKNYKINIFIA
jgi:hypothetical protein